MPGEEARRGTLPAEHPRILASTIWRLTHGWLAPGIDQARYIRAATALAMRRKQVRLMGDAAPAFYRDEVVRLRQQVVSLLHPLSRGA